MSKMEPVVMTPELRALLLGGLSDEQLRAAADDWEREHPGEGPPPPEFLRQRAGRPN